MWERTATYNVSALNQTDAIISKDGSTAFFYETLDGETLYTTYRNVGLIEDDQDENRFQSGFSSTTVTAAALSGDGKFLFLGQTFEATSTSSLYVYGRDDTLASGSLWTLKVKGPHFDLQSEKVFAIASVSSSWNGSTVAFAASDGSNGTVRVAGLSDDGIWERAELERKDYDSSTRVALSADGKRLVVAYADEIRAYENTTSSRINTSDWLQIGSTIEDNEGPRQLELESMRNGHLFSYGSFGVKNKWQLLRWYQNSFWDSIVTTSRNQIAISANGNVLALLGHADRGNSTTSVSLYGLPTENVPIANLQGFTFPPGDFIKGRLSTDGSRLVVILSDEMVVYEKFCSGGGDEAS